MSSSPSQSSEVVLAPEDWVDAYGDSLYRYALTRLRDANAAEEVVQETFLSGIRNQTQFSGRGSQAGWLVGILRRKILDFVRDRSRFQQTPLEEEYDPANGVFDERGHWKQGILPRIGLTEPVETSELWSVIRSCLDGLPQIQADVFVLSVMEEMESEEICKELGITPSNYWVRLHRARLGLAKCVGAKWLDAQG